MTCESCIMYIVHCFWVQGQCEPSAIEFIRIAEAMPVLAMCCKHSAKLRCFSHPHNTLVASFYIPQIWYIAEKDIIFALLRTFFI